MASIGEAPVLQLTVGRLLVNPTDEFGEFNVLILTPGAVLAVNLKSENVVVPLRGVFGH